ncbi:Gfo/Idh/MocA family protein [Sciscionella marina]|uniref:Gfo/Idh/MocA family protein n=1 Tax=Sciscionella marina TaxID=508770 RepID=UPI00035E24F4|nr:Gfo/Idh/MocA family oxidoreductase [Sciscionella marina]
MSRIKIGLVGAGPWANRVHAPSIAAHPRTELAGVWARRDEAAQWVAEANGGQVFGSLEELYASVDAVTFAVPPQVQAEHALAAVRAGRHVILEKPIAASLENAERLVKAIEAAGVASLVMLTRRFADETRNWLAAIGEREDWQGGTATWLSGALLGGEYRDSAWRHERGALDDIGPHVLDLVDAALGPITEVRAAQHTADGLWQLLLGHRGGRTSTVTLSLHVPVRPSRLKFTAIGPAGASSLEGRETPAPDSFAMLLDEFTTMLDAGETRHACDARRGLHLQRLLAEARDRAGS